MRERLATIFRKRDDPYAGVDLANASRFGGALWFVGAAFTAAPGRGLPLGRRRVRADPAAGSAVFDAPQPQG